MKTLCAGISYVNCHLSKHNELHFINEKLQMDIVQLKMLLILLFSLKLTEEITLNKNYWIFVMKEAIITTHAHTQINEVNHTQSYWNLLNILKYVPPRNGNASILNLFAFLFQSDSSWILNPSNQMKMRIFCENICKLQMLKWV